MYQQLSKCKCQKGVLGRCGRWWFFSKLLRSLSEDEKKIGTSQD